MVVFLRRKINTTMANEKKSDKKSETKKTEKKQLRVIVEPRLSGLIKSANDAGVTDKEFQYVGPIPAGFVLVYYR